MELAKRKICDAQACQVRTENVQRGEEIADFGVPADKELPLGRVDTVPRERVDFELLYSQTGPMSVQTFSTLSRCTRTIYKNEESD